MRIEFTIPCFVHPKQGGRVQVVSRGGKTWAHHHQPDKVIENARAITTLCAQHRPETPMRGPIRLTLSFQYPWRKSEPQKNRHCQGVRAGKPKDTNPDLGNLEKQIEDVLERAGFFVNDAQIAERHSQKGWCDQGGVSVVIETM